MSDELKHYGVKGMKWDPSKKTGKTYEELYREKFGVDPGQKKFKKGTQRTMTDEEYAEFKKRRETNSKNQSKPSKSTDYKPEDRHKLSSASNPQEGFDRFFAFEKKRRANAKREREEKERKKKEFKKSKKMKTLKLGLRSSPYSVKPSTRTIGKTYVETAFKDNIKI